MQNLTLTSVHHHTPLKTLLSLCLTATCAQLLTACDETAVSMTQPPMVETPETSTPEPLPMPLPEGREVALGGACEESSDCASDICYFTAGRSRGICVDTCDVAGSECGDGGSCQPHAVHGFICLPGEQPGTPGSSGLPGDVACEVAPNRNFVYMVDSHLNIRSFNPETEEVQERGGCDLNDVFATIEEEMSAAGYPDHTIGYNVSDHKFTVSSFAVSSTGQGFIAFTTTERYNSTYGVITVPNVSSVIECTTTVNFIDEGIHALTLSVAKDPNDNHTEKLYGNLFTTTKMGHGQDRGEVAENENISPSRVFEIDMDNTAEHYPVLSLQDFRLAELAQDSQGQMLSLFTEDVCHGECYLPEPGLPRPEGINVKMPHVVEVDMTTETLGQVYPLVIPDPYNIQCGYNSGDDADKNCKYSPTYNVAFLNGDAYLVYSQAVGQSYDNLNLTNLRNELGNSTMRKLEFDPATQSYKNVTNVGEEVSVPGVIVGAASVSCR